MIPALVVIAWLAMPSFAKASCGYYVVIGRPGAEASEQMRLRQDQMPLEHKKLPCNGPQCRRHDRPVNPAALITVLSHDAMPLAATNQDRDESFILAWPQTCSLFSDPHIWRIDPPPRA